MLNTEEFGRRLASLRRRSGKKQRQIAEELGLTPQAVSKWEAGKCCPDIEILPELAAFFGVSIDELLLGECLTQTKFCDQTKDPLILSAIKTAQNKKYISTSILQRSLNIGYTTAKRVIEDMCKCGYLKKDTTAPYDRYLYTENIESDS